jgi:hypothetical protein
VEDDDDLGRWQVPRTDLRRMVLGVLIRAGRPMTVAEVVAAVEVDGPPLHLRPGQHAHKVLADLLRQQVRAGRVRRVARGTYTVGTLSPSMRWRSLHWRELRWEDNQASRSIWRSLGEP